MNRPLPSPGPISAQDHAAIRDEIRAALRIEDDQRYFFRVHPNIRRFFEWEIDKWNVFNEDLEERGSPWADVLWGARFADYSALEEACRHAWTLDDLAGDVLELRRRGWSDIRVRRGGRLLVTVHPETDPRPGLAEWRRDAFRSLIRWRYAEMRTGCPNDCGHCLCIERRIHRWDPADDEARIFAAWREIH